MPDGPGQNGVSPEPSGSERQRLDKWLWHARFAKSRTRASDFVREGFARINGVRTEDPARTVKIGDVLTLALASKAIVVKIRRILPRRMDPAGAQTAYVPMENGSPASGTMPPR